MVAEYIELTRYREWITILFVIILGAYLANNFNLIWFIALVFLTFCVLSYAFVINNIFDAAYDRTDKNPISKGVIKKGRALLFSAVLLLSGAAASSFLVPHILPMYTVLVSIGTIYSAPPFRLKEKFPFDSLLHGSLGALIFLMAYTTFAPVNTLALMIFIILFILNLGSEILQEIRDYKEDISNRFNTTVNVLGIKNSLILLKILLLANMLLSFTVLYYFLPLYFLVFMLPYIPFFRLYFLKPFTQKNFPSDVAHAMHNSSLMLFCFSPLVFVISLLL